MEVKHLGDICKINGAEIEIVDVITGGSPCQDLSIAGKRAGLAGARSGLFMEQVRIVKEMRERDRANGRTGDMVRPRFMVWENVPGAFSSNKGQDFAAVLEEIIRIGEPEAPDIEVPEKGWPTWGGYHDEVGGRWSVAWRVHDAQYWGVPQRRRRISVVADFGGDTAGEILFECKSVSGYLAESRAAREGLAGNAESGASSAVRIRGGCDGGGKGTLVQQDCVMPSQALTEVASTLRAGAGAPKHDADIRGRLAISYKRATCAGFKPGNSEHAQSIGYAEEQAPTLNAECGGNKPAVMCLNDQGGNVMGVSHDVSSTLRAQEHGHQPSILDMSHACDIIRDCGEIVPSLQARMGTGGNQVPLTYQMQGFGDYRAGEVASSCKQLQAAGL
jgi:DNA (cytosine-5)-methyltransferase 1|nr:MAG TPA: Cytosine specific methyltransferase [Caudoviricetes sp.]